MGENRIALVDMDGTLCDYEGDLYRELKRVLRNDETLTNTGMKRLKEIIKNQPGFWRALPPIELGMQILEILKEVGFDIHVLTKGPYRTTSAWTEKVEWCREHIPGTPVTITENKGMVYGRILVDDWPGYCESWLEWRPRGLVIMPAHPYNEGFAQQHPDRVVRTNGSNLDVVRERIQAAYDRSLGEE